MRRLGVLLLVVLAFAGIGFADIQGSALIQRSYAGADTCIGCLFAYIPFQPQDVGGHVTDWGIYASQAGNDITPLLLEKGSGFNFTIVGIGTTQHPTTTGVQWFSFGLDTGVDTVDANTYFGWRDGNASGSVTNAGTISLDLNGGPGLEYYIGPPYQFSGGISVNQTYGFINASTDTRSYSVEAVVPEPSAILLLGFFGVGLSAFSGALRRRLN
jgi:hypothetical protein